MFKLFVALLASSTILDMSSVTLATSSNVWPTLAIPFKASPTLPPPAMAFAPLDIPPIPAAKASPVRICPTK